MIRAGDLDRRVVVQRNGGALDAFGGVAQGWATLLTLWAMFRPISDGERWQSGRIEARAAARFTLRWSAPASGIRETDRIAHDGGVWAILGIKEVGRREFLEITAERSDGQ